MPGTGFSTGSRSSGAGSSSPSSARREEQLRENLACLEFEIPDEQMARLDEVSQVSPGFPHDFLGRPDIRKIMLGDKLDLIDDHRR